MILSSVFPPHHTWCEAGSQPLPPAQISGLLDGDGYVGLVAQRYPDRVTTKPRLMPVTRDDDPTPLVAWASVGAYLGRPVGHVLHDERDHRFVWSVGGTGDVVDFLAWLAHYPSLSPRGWRKAAALREGALLLADASRPRPTTSHELGATWRNADGGQGRRKLAEALFVRLAVLGVTEMNVELTEEAERHGFAAVIPHEIRLSVSGRGERT